MLRALDEFLKNEFQRGLLLLEKLFSLRNRLENCGQLFRAILLEAVELREDLAGETLGLLVSRCSDLLLHGHLQPGLVGDYTDG